MDREHLKGLKVAILVEDGFEQVELVEPRKALDQAGAETRIVSPKGDRSEPESYSALETSCFRSTPYKC